MSGPLIKVNEREPRVLELEDEGSFARAVQQAGPNTKVDVVIEITFDPPEGNTTEVFEIENYRIRYPRGRRWHLWSHYWTGWRPSFEGGLPHPTRAELEKIRQAANAVAARWRASFRPLIAR